MTVTIKQIKQNSAASMPLSFVFLLYRRLKQQQNGAKSCFVLINFSKFLFDSYKKQYDGKHQNLSN